MRGVPVARAVARARRPRSRSSGETRLRLRLGRRGGPAATQVQPRTSSTRTAAVVGHARPARRRDRAGRRVRRRRHRDLASTLPTTLARSASRTLGLVVVRATSLDVGPAAGPDGRRLPAGHERAARAVPVLGLGDRARSHDPSRALVTSRAREPRRSPRTHRDVARARCRQGQVPRTRARSLSQRSASRASAPWRVGR